MQTSKIAEALVITSVLAKEQERREKETNAIKQRSRTHPVSLEGGSEISANRPEMEGGSDILGSKLQTFPKGKKQKKADKNTVEVMKDATVLERFLSSYNHFW